MFNEEPYLNYVSEQAEKIGKIFFLDSGEGNDMIDPQTGWYIENLSGWLISPAEKKNFLIAQNKGSIDDAFSKFYVFVEWSKDVSGKLKITFKQY